MGRSRGGLTTKIHALVDAMGLPIALKLTAGQAHDGRSAEDMFSTVRAGTILLADRAYDSNALREWLAERGAWGNIRAMPHRVDPPAFSGWLYRQRNAVERFFNKLKHFRAVATRYDKRDDNYLASVKLASLRIWLRFNESMTEPLAKLPGLRRGISSGDGGSAAVLGFPVFGGVVSCRRSVCCEFRQGFALPLARWRD